MSSRSKRGRRRNRGRFSLLFKLLAGAALVAALTFGATVFFQVEHILIAGNSRYTAQEVESALKALDEGSCGEVLRAKGILPRQGGGWLHFDYTPGEINVREGTPDYTGRLCVIGSELKEDRLKEVFRL